MRSISSYKFIELSRKVQSPVSRKEIFPVLPTSMKRKKTQLLPTAVWRLSAGKWLPRTLSLIRPRSGGICVRPLCPVSGRDEQGDFQPCGWKTRRREGRVWLRNQITSLICFLIWTFGTHVGIQRFFSIDNSSQLPSCNKFNQQTLPYNVFSSEIPLNPIYLMQRLFSCLLRLLKNGKQSTH